MSQFFKHQHIIQKGISLTDFSARNFRFGKLVQQNITDQKPEAWDDFGYVKSEEFPMDRF